LYQRVQQNRKEKWANKVEMKVQQEFLRWYKGKLIGQQIRHKKRKQKGWELDNNDDGNSNNEYPVAMNELAGYVMSDAEDEDSICSSESSIEWKQTIVQKLHVNRIIVFSWWGPEQSVTWHYLKGDHNTIQSVTWHYQKGDHNTIQSVTWHYQKGNHNTFQSVTWHYSKGNHNTCQSVTWHKKTM
jgi:hypothetical protein